MLTKAQKDQLKKEHDITIDETESEVNVAGWRVLFKASTEKYTDFPTGILHFGLKKWLNEFSACICRFPSLNSTGSIDYILLVDENCPEYYFVENDEIKDIIRTINRGLNYAEMFANNWDVVKSTIGIDTSTLIDSNIGLQGTTTSTIYGGPDNYFTYSSASEAARRTCGYISNRFANYSSKTFFDSDGDA